MIGREILSPDCLHIPKPMMDTQDFLKEIKRLEIAQRYEEGLQTVNQAIEAFPTEGVFYVRKGHLLFNLHREREALESYEQAIQLGVNEWRVYMDCASIKQDLDDIAGAFAYYQKAIDAGGTSYHLAYLVRGHLYKNQGDWKNAILDYYQHFLQKMESSRLFFDSGNPLQEFESIYGTHPDFPEALVIRAVLKDESNDLTGAIADLKEAMTKLPEKKLEAYLSSLQFYVDHKIDWNTMFEHIRKPDGSWVVRPISQPNTE